MPIPIGGGEGDTEKTGVAVARGLILVLSVHKGVKSENILEKRRSNFCNG